MLSISKPLSASSAEKYYDRDNYYLESHGTWNGNLAPRFNLSGAISKKDFSTFLHGFDKEGNKLLASAGAERSQKGRGHRSGVDLTFSAPKSISVLAYYDSRIEKAFHKALSSTMSHIEDSCSQYRIKKKGSTNVLKSNKLLWSQFTHRCSRELDPQLHVHCVVFNMTEGKEGQIKALLNDQFYRRKMYLGQHFRNELASEIKNLGYGISISDRKKGLFEIEGIDREVIEAFSKRRMQVEQRAQELREVRFKDLPREKLQLWAENRVERYKNSANYKKLLKSELTQLLNSKDLVYSGFSDAQLFAQAALDSRIPKENVTKEHIVDLINQTCSSFNTTLEELHKNAMESSKSRDSLPLREIVLKALDDVTEQQSGFEKHKLYQHALKLGLGDHTFTEIDNEFNHLLQSGEIKHLGGKYSASGTKDYFSSKEMITIENEVMEICKSGRHSSSINVNGNHLSSFIADTNLNLHIRSIFNLNKESFNEFLKELPISKHKSALLEYYHLYQNTKELDINGIVEKHAFIKDQFLSHGYGLTPGQKDAIRHIASTNCQFSVIQGDAGTGKSFAMSYAREILEKNNFTVRGFAPTGKASQELSDSSHIRGCSTMDSFLLKFKNSSIDNRAEMFNNNKECWIVDEAGMCGSRKIREFMKVAEYAGAKVIFVGDRKQFASIEAGKMFSDMQDKAGVDVIVMPDVMRQKTEQTKDIVKAISLKEIDFAFSIMQGRKEISDIDKTDINSYKKDQLLHFTSPILSIPKDASAKVIAVNNTTVRLEYFDEDSRIPFKIDIDPTSYADSFKLFSPCYDNVIEEHESREERLDRVAKDYLDHTSRGIDTMVITSSNKNRKNINEIIRKNLVERESIPKSFEFIVFEPHSLGGENASLADSYKVGQVVFTNNKIGHIPRGTQGEIVKTDLQHNTITLKYWDRGEGCYKDSEIKVPSTRKKLSLYNKQKKQFGVGDKIVFLKNDKKVGVRNGQLGEIISLDSKGNVKAKIGEGNKGKIVEFNLSNRGENGYNYIDWAYCLTTYKSQGATISRLIWEAAATEGDVSSNAFYVAITRCKNEIAVYTDNAEELREKVKHEQIKISTLDFAQRSNSNPIIKNHLFTINNDLSTMNSYELPKIDVSELNKKMVETVPNKKNNTHGIEI